MIRIDQRRVADGEHRLESAIGIAGFRNRLEPAAIAILPSIRLRIPVRL